MSEAKVKTVERIIVAKNGRKIYDSKNKNILRKIFSLLFRGGEARCHGKKPNTIK